MATLLKTYINKTEKSQKKNAFIKAANAYFGNNVNL